MRKGDLSLISDLGIIDRYHKSLSDQWSDIKFRMGQAGRLKP